MCQSTHMTVYIVRQPMNVCMNKNALCSLSCKLSLCNPRVKVNVQLFKVVLAAQQDWLLKSLPVLCIQVLVPLIEVLLHHLIQNLDHLVIAENELLAAV